MDNMAHSGKVKISLQNQASIKECKDPNVSGHGECWMSLNGHIWLWISADLSVIFFSTTFVSLSSASTGLSGELCPGVLWCAGGVRLPAVPAAVWALHRQGHLPAACEAAHQTFIYLCCEEAVLLGDSKISTLHMRSPFMNTIRLFCWFQICRIISLFLLKLTLAANCSKKRKLVIIINILLQLFCLDHSKATRLQSGNLVMKERVAQRNRMTQCQAVVTDNTLMLN